ncbi:D-alanine--D-alanine ligase family protein [Streptococcus respiraculi]|uniref:D-alanine--D-alanine ligase family protein n=1 Tax=Streptococcus respiraculi TaxID=2021971 RepID=UPI000E71CE32|nr:D-alanine--D-alanine ligase [Streptococcus respiraculi]
MKIMIISGGNSDENKISMLSGQSICKALKRLGHEVVIQQIPSLVTNSDIGSFLISNIEQYKKVDIVFIALHGGVGENGQLQSILDAFGIRYTGSGYIGSVLAMDKHITKALLNYHGIKTPNGILLSKEELESFSVTEHNLECPLIIKPNNNGSSFGVEIFNSIDEFYDIKENVTKFGQSFLIEEKIEGREFSVGIVGDMTLPPIEIIVEDGFYDFEHKYNGSTKEVVPALISKELETKIKEISKKVHKILRLDAYSRIDCIVDKNNDIYVIEANSLPGMTEYSLLPQEAAAVGISYEKLCEQIILESIKKYKL